MLAQELSLELEMVEFCLMMSNAVEQNQAYWSVLTEELVVIIVAIMKMLV